MGKKVLFLDSVEKADGTYNVTYGTDDINAIVRSLTGAGVSIFPSGETFNVSELNSITEAMVGAGATFDGLRVSLEGGKIHIAPGTGFFENGAIITVDSEGEELEYNVSENVYVYAEYDKNLNACDFRTSEEAPEDVEGIYRIMLAVISADGSVNDRRTMATSKVASMGKNLTKEVVVIEQVSDTSFVQKHYYAGEIIYEFNDLSVADISRLNLMRFTGRISSDSSFNVYLDFETLFSSEDYSHYVRAYGSFSLYIRFKDEKLQLYVPEFNNSLYCSLCSLTVTFY